MDSLITVLSYPFIQRAIIAGCIIAISTAFLSVFVTLRNMSFYADAISHSALAGIAIGIMLGVAPFPAAIVFCVFLGLGTVYIKNRSTVSIDTIIGVLFAAGISLGVALISRLQEFRTDLFTFLFGDVLAVTWNDILVSTVLTIVILIYLLYTSKQLLLSTFSEDFSIVRGIKTVWLEYSFFAITALTIAMSIKVVGIILITGLLIIPGAIGKNLGKSFKQTVFWSLIFSVFSAISGIIISYYLDIPSGPSIILVGASCFIITTIIRRR
ncbi:MAG: metal ABC transporter permease [bacterium]|nr:metal ABC transporter permease [bacterium]